MTLPDPIRIHNHEQSYRLKNMQQIDDKGDDSHFEIEYESRVDDEGTRIERLNRLNEGFAEEDVAALQQQKFN